MGTNFANRQHSMSNFHYEVQICIHTVLIEALCYAAIITPDI